MSVIYQEALQRRKTMDETFLNETTRRIREAAEALQAQYQNFEIIRQQLRELIGKPLKDGTQLQVFSEPSSFKLRLQGRPQPYGRLENDTLYIECGGRKVITSVHPQHMFGISKVHDTVEAVTEVITQWVADRL